VNDLMSRGIEKRLRKEKSERLRGKSDCLNGVPHQDQGMYYNLGYSEQYEAEQRLQAYIDSVQPQLVRRV
jgi:hypothetical protein